MDKNETAAPVLNLPAEVDTLARSRTGARSKIGPGVAPTETRLTYGTIMVHLEIGQPNTLLLQVAHDLAVRHDAAVVGIAVGQPTQVLYSDGYVYPDLIEDDRKRLEADLAAAEAEFQAAFATHEPRRWRSFVVLGMLAATVADEARCADLIVTGAVSGTSRSISRQLNTGDLIMQAGRPVLIVPEGAVTPTLRQVLVGWKDTREARRAIADALPMLRLAEQVCVAEVAAADDLETAEAHLADVAVWLMQHGIFAETLPTLASGDDSTRLDQIARDRGCDLVVAGAYGHSRVREWALGGVTRDMLRRTGRCTLLSH